MARIAVLYSDTGGGHRTAAQAIELGIRRLYGDAHDVALINAIGSLPYPFNYSEDTYATAMQKAGFLHGLSYHSIDGRRRMRWVGALASSFDGARLRAFAAECRADVVVSCQPHFNGFMPNALRRAGRPVRYAHVVTDLNRVHRWHFPPALDLCIVPTDEVRAEALANGVPTGRIVTTGYPIDLDFRADMGERAANRKRLNLRDNLRTVLVMGGGEGMGELIATARALLQSSLPIELLIVCGRNEAARLAIEALAVSAPSRVFGFVDNIPELMGASDMLVTKAGAGTLCEALCAGLPIALYDAVPGQEVGNRDYVVAHGAAAWCPKPEQVVAQIACWVADPPARSRVAAAAATLAKPDAGLDAARAIANLAAPPRP